VFTSVELAGELVGLQMGLNFASFFDPSSNAQVSAVSRFMGHMSTLLFVVMNGHLIVLMAVIKSFESFPVDGNFFDTLQHIKLYSLGSSLFSSALWIALPMIGMLLFVNLAMGVISRVAPQMNIYSIGFPVTLTMGLVGVTITLPMLDQPVMALMEKAIDLFTAK
jgi:flagellar biosynthetic protein FliR